MGYPISHINPHIISYEPIIPYVIIPYKPNNPYTPIIPYVIIPQKPILFIWLPMIFVMYDFPFTNYKDQTAAPYMET